jgi:23S rRNA (cytidine1920-2'-O)/16S rRNA (cytidine1409-2'-O)-methyltransferase
MPRLDLHLVGRGFYATRARARDAIRRGTVRVDGRLAEKPGALVSPDSAILVEDPARTYVSRGALKLIHALDKFGLDPAGTHCLDIGASTGGFTEVLLERGALSVTAIDVGHGQLSPSLAQDPRVRQLSGLNARDLAGHHLAAPPQFIVADVSFISLKLALRPALDLAVPPATLVALVKPQFEAGRKALSKAGIVRDEAAQRAAVAAVAAFIAGHGFSILGVEPSPILGSDGNREFLLAGRRH